MLRCWLPVGSPGLKSPSSSRVRLMPYVRMNGGPLPIGPFNQTNHDPGRITWTNVRLGRVIQVAYDFPIDRISGPDWLFHDVVTIVATLPAGTGVGDFRLMLGNLLAERFRLVVHRETKQVSGYVLQIGRMGRSSRRVARKPPAKRNRKAAARTIKLACEARSLPACTRSPPGSTAHPSKPRQEHS